MAENLNGYVTQVGSRADFYIGATHIRIDAKTKCNTESLDEEIYLPHGSWYPPALTRSFELRDHPDLNSTASVSCDKVPAMLGSHVEVTGHRDEPDQPLRATRVTIFAVNIDEQFAPAAMDQDWTGGALLEEQPQITRLGKGWTGTVWLNGYPWTITPDTELLSAPRGTEISYRPVRFFRDPQWTAVMPKSPVPAFSPSLLEPNSLAIYRATYLQDDTQGSGMVADGDLVHPSQTSSPHVTQLPWLQRIRLWQNQRDEQERRYIAQFTPVVHLPDFANRKAGSVGFEHQSADKRLKILPDQAIQEFVSKLGWSLVPEYQRAMPLSDPTRISFRFYVVQAPKSLSNDQMSRANSMVLARHKNLDRGVAALPDGTILVPDYMLARLDNEAQLATLLSCAIASVVQKQGFVTRTSSPWRSRDDTGDGFAYPIYGFVFYLMRNEQAIRLGIRQMYLAGYDIREAPFAWAEAGGRSISNPLPETGRSSSGIPWYAAYAFDYINRYYQDIDYAKLKRGKTEYAAFLDELRQTDPGAFKSRRAMQVIR